MEEGSPTRRRVNLCDVLYIVAAFFPDAGNVAVGCCKATWTDERIWLAIVDMLHSPVKASTGEVYITACRMVIASSKGRLDVVKRMLGFGAKIEAKSAMGNSSLALACKEGHADVAKYLIDECGAEIDSLNNDNMTPLSHACFFAHVEASRVLLERNASVTLGNDPPIFACVQDIHDDDRADVDAAIFWARRLAVLRLLAQQGADLDVVGEHSWRPLVWAAQNGQVEMIDFLCESLQVDVNALDVDNKSALSHACFYARVDVVRSLLLHGANPNHGDAPILDACEDMEGDFQEGIEMEGFWTRRLEVIRLLADHGANLNLVGDEGWTPLTWACSNGQVDIITFLLDQGVNIDALDFNNESGVSWASFYGHIEAVEVLIARGANINLGHAPIIAAVLEPEEEDDGTARADEAIWSLWANRLRIVRLLIAKGADLLAIDANGLTALNLAREAKQWDIVIEIEDALHLPGATWRRLRSFARAKVWGMPIFGVNLLIFVSAVMASLAFFYWVHSILLQDKGKGARTEGAFGGGGGALQEL